MDLRSLIILSIVVAGCVYALKNAYVGALLMSWVAYMNPHRMSWGFAYSMPIALVATAVTALALVFSKEKSAPPLRAPLVYLLLFIFWAIGTSFFAWFPDEAMEELVRFLKIQIMILFTLMLFQNKEKLIWLVLVVSLSIGFFGFKGGVFAVATAGSYRVWGPPGSFIEGNNELALALLMVVPLIYFLHGYYQNKWIKRGLMLVMGFSLLAVLASYSRGALLALACTGAMLWWKSAHKFKIGVVAIILVLSVIPFIPQQWYDRMNTIETYEEDASAMGRINSWYVAYNIASDRIAGGGFRHWSKETFALYAPSPEDVHDAHSIYFEVLGELGFPGLILFLLMHFSNWFLASRTIKLCSGNEKLEWAEQLMKMVQVSMVAYATGGTFLGLAFWDLPYHLICFVVLTNVIVRKELDQSGQKKSGLRI
ncbi:MAG: putative O-glycosylation ligase, exosortase A system-associated [Hahellaceae bacterium]|nr:putative O-glycosylation ligase, exosortase A system-associated [Hahellaceae bacterium]